MLTLKQAFNYITSGVNQRGSTLLLGTTSLIQYLNMALLQVYFFEGKGWNWMRRTETFIIPPFTTVGETYEVTTVMNIAMLHTMSAPGMCNNNAGFISQNTDINLGPGEVYIEGSSDKIIFGKGREETTVEVVYYGYSLFTETALPELNEEVIVPISYLPAVYHFALALIYPHYTQYGENREVSAYQMGMNHLANMSKSQTTVINTIRQK